MTTSHLSPQQGCAVAARRWLSAVIFCVFLVVGCVFLVVSFWGGVLVRWRVSHRYQETACVVLAGRLDQQMSSGGSDPEGVAGGEDLFVYRPEILIQYEVNGQNYRTWTYDLPPRGGFHSCGGRPNAQAALDGFTVGHVYPCWYDPDEPGEVVLVRGYRHLWWLCFPWLFILIGGFGLIWLLRTRKTGSRRELA